MTTIHWMAKSDFANMEAWALCGRKVHISQATNHAPAPFTRAGKSVTCESCLKAIAIAAVHLQRFQLADLAKLPEVAGR